MPPKKTKASKASVSAAAKAPKDDRLNYVISKAQNAGDDTETQCWLLLAQAMSDKASYDVQFINYRMHVGKADVKSARRSLIDFLDLAESKHFDRAEALCVDVLKPIVEDVYAKQSSSVLCDVYKGLPEPDRLRLLTHFISNAPNDLLLPRLYAFALIARDETAQLPSYATQIITEARAAIDTVEDEPGKRQELVNLVARDFASALFKSARTCNDLLSREDAEWLSSITQLHVLHTALNVASDTQQTPGDVITSTDTSSTERASSAVRSSLPLLTRAQQALARLCKLGRNSDNLDMSTVAGLGATVNSVQQHLEKNSQDAALLCALPLAALSVHYLSQLTALSLTFNECCLALLNEYVGFEDGTSDAAPVPVKKRKYDAQIGAQARPQVSLHQLFKNSSSTLGATATNKQLQELLAAGTRLVSFLEQHASVDDVVKNIDASKALLESFIVECYEYAGRHNDVIRRCRLAKKDDDDIAKQDHPLTCARLGIAYAQQRKTPLALRYLRKALELCSDDDRKRMQSRWSPEASVQAHYTLVDRSHILLYAASLLVYSLSKQDASDAVIGARLVLSQMYGSSLRSAVRDAVAERGRLDCSSLVQYVKDDAHWLAQISQWARDGICIAHDEGAEKTSSGTRGIASRMRRACEEVECAARDAIETLDESEAPSNVTKFILSTKVADLLSSL